nr:major outer capsid protein [Fijivirus sp.]
MASKTKLEVNPSFLTSGPVIRPGDNVILNQKNILLLRETFQQLLEYQNVVVIPNASGDPQAVSVQVKMDILEQLLDMFQGRDLSGYEHLSNFIDTVLEYVRTKRSTGFQVNGMKSNFVGLTRKIIGLMENAYNDVISMEDDLITTKVTGDLVLKPACAEGLDSILEENYIDTVHTNAKIDTNQILEDIMVKVPLEFGINTSKRNSLSHTKGNAGKILVGGSVSQRSIFEIGNLGERYSQLMLDSLGTFGMIVGFIPIRTFDSVFLSSDELSALDPDKPLVCQNWKASATMTHATLATTGGKQFITDYLSTPAKAKTLLSHNLDAALFYKVYGGKSTTNTTLAEKVLKKKDRTAYDAMTADASTIPDFEITVSPNTVKDLFEEAFLANAKWRLPNTSATMSTEQVKGIMDSIKKGWTRFRDFVIEHKELVDIGIKAACNQFAPHLNSKFGLTPADISTFVTDGPAAFVNKKENWQTLCQAIGVNILPALGEYAGKGTIKQMYSSLGLHDRYEQYYKNSIKLLSTTSSNTVSDKKYTLVRMNGVQPILSRTSSSLRGVY